MLSEAELTWMRRIARGDLPSLAALRGDCGSRNLAPRLARAGLITAVFHDADGQRGTLSELYAMGVYGKKVQCGYELTESGRAELEAAGGTTGKRG